MNLVLCPICQAEFKFRSNKQYCSRQCKEVSRKKPWKKIAIRKTCIQCGFIPENICQLDVDHIDGNKKNNEPHNLQVLCANCHRLKTQKSGDWISKWK